MSSTRGFVGRQPVNVRTSESRGVPSASSPGVADANEALAARIAAGVEAWEFNPRAVAAELLALDPAHQKRVAQIVFSLIRHWNVMAGHGYGPDHPMYPEWTLARSMMANLSNAEFPA